MYINSERRDLARISMYVHWILIIQYVISLSNKWKEHRIFCPADQSPNLCLVIIYLLDNVYKVNGI